MCNGLEVADPRLQASTRSLDGCLNDVYIHYFKFLLCRTMNGQETNRTIPFSALASIVHQMPKRQLL
jgi:hypothetical protein